MGLGDVDREQVHVSSRAELRRWLAQHHQSSPGIWLVTFKKAGGERYLPYDDIIEEALCFGWVDSKARVLDEHRSMLTLTPRNPRSSWSRANKERIDRLVADGLMAPAGLGVVEAAKRSGTWTALDEVEQLIEPPELTAALEAHPRARGHWDAFPRSTRRAILEWISTAKTATTRQKRVSETAELAAQNVRANQWPRAVH